VANSAVIAIIASLLVISAYIALRFEWKYAVPVLIALMHDLLITAGVYSLTARSHDRDRGGLLTILGYSLYDTIIVFDRVREKRAPNAARRVLQIVNRSMSEVLTRSLATSFCTLLPVLALLFFGGETLKDFAFALMVGIASAPTPRSSSPRRCLRTGRSARPPTATGAHGSCANSARCRLRDTVAGEPVDVEPTQKRKRTRRGSLIAPETLASSCQEKSSRNWCATST